jgi:hypothetical protein
MVIDDAMPGSRVEEFLEEVATRVESEGIRRGWGASGTGPRQGSVKHTYAERLVGRYQQMTRQRTHLEIERSYLNGGRVSRGTSGSSRPDVYDPVSGDVYDYKFVRNPGQLLPAQ